MITSTSNCQNCYGTGQTIDYSICECAAKIQKIKPVFNCSICNGTGEVYDVVDYGSTTALLPSYCSCIETQIEEDTDEIEIVFDEPEKEQEQ